MTVRLIHPSIGKAYEGLSTDTKPTGVSFNSTFREQDTNFNYITYDGVNWHLVPAAGKHKHLAATGLVKASKGVLYGLTINSLPTTAEATITLYDSVDDSGAIIAIISMSKPVSVVPASLAYNVVLEEGLYIVFSHEAGTDVTVSYG